MELLNYVNERVADYKKIRGGLAYVSSIPRNQVGKLQRSFLTKWANSLSTKTYQNQIL